MSDKAKSDKAKSDKPSPSELVSKFIAESADATPDYGPCAICGRAATPEYRPFCTRRCADVDLGRWLRGSYAIPVGREAEDDEESERDG